MTSHVVMTFLLAVFCLLCSRFAQASLDPVNKGLGNRSCPVKSVIRENAHNGWPYSFDCGELINYDHEMWTCVVSEQGSETPILNVTMELDYMYDYKHFIDVVHENKTNVYYLDLIGEDGSCFRHVIELNFSDVEDTTCHESQANTKHWKSEIEIGKTIKLPCVSGLEDTHKIHAKDDHNHTVVWRRNCSDVSNISGIWIDSTKQMVVGQVGFHHPGIYSCSYIINGQEKFVAHQRVCVKPAAATGKAVMKCAHKVHRVTIGQRLLVECVMSRGKGYTKNMQHILKWKKVVGSNTTNVCVNNVIGQEDGWDKRVHCNFTTQEYPCFLHIPSEAEKEESMFTNTVTLSIDQVKESDLGEYLVAVRLDQVEVANDTFIIVLDREPHVISVNYVILICLACVIFLLVVVVLLCWQRFYICLYHKRSFGKYETDDKKYGAFISYHFSTEMDKFAQQLTREATAATITNLESLGYRVYDEHRDGYPSELRVDSSVNAMRLCHRVVIVLTPEYLKDHWSIFCLQRSFQNMIDSNKKLIFVMVPGTKEYIRQHSDVDETHRMIRSAIKLNHALQWSDSRNFDKRRFKLELEWAMPKLATQRSVRHESTTSSLLSQQYANGFHRTMSVETEVTEAGSPKPTGEQFTCFVIEPDTCPSNTSL